MYFQRFQRYPAIKDRPWPKKKSDVGDLAHVTAMVEPIPICALLQMTDRQAFCFAVIYQHQVFLFVNFKWQHLVGHFQLNIINLNVAPTWLSWLNRSYHSWAPTSKCGHAFGFPESRAASWGNSYWEVVFEVQGSVADMHRAVMSLASAGSKGSSLDKYILPASWMMISGFVLATRASHFVRFMKQRDQ